MRRGRLERLSLLFTGKLAISEIGVLAGLAEEGVVTPPEILPPNMSDVSALASWMAFSNLLNRIDLDAMERHLGPALGGGPRERPTGRLREVTLLTVSGQPTRTR